VGSRHSRIREPCAGAWGRFRRQGNPGRPHGGLGRHRGEQAAAAGEAAHANRIQLWSDGFYRTPKIHCDKTNLTGRPFCYFAYGAACTGVAIDTLTGESRVLRVDILHAVGRSINPAIDIGQIEGGFVQGMGWRTPEQLVGNDKAHLSTHAPSTYKIPATGDRRKPAARPQMVVPASAASTGAGA